MFTFVEWDDPLILVMELALSVAFIAGVMFVARLVNRNSASSPRSEADVAAEVAKKDD